MTQDERMALVEGRNLTVKEASKISGMGATWLYGAMDRGDLPYLKLGGKARRIPEVALRKLMADSLVCR